MIGLIDIFGNTTGFLHIFTWFFGFSIGSINNLIHALQKFLASAMVMFGLIVYVYVLISSKITDWNSFPYIKTVVKKTGVNVLKEFLFVKKYYFYL